LVVDVVLCRLPQLLYGPSAGGTPSAAFLPASAATPTALTALAQPSPQSPAQALAAVGHPLIESSTLAFAAGPQLHASAGGFDALQAAPAAGFLAHTAAAAPSATFTPIAYAAPAATPVSTPGVHQLAHYRPLSIQDRI